MKKQTDFSFCEQCGSYILAGHEHVIQVDGQTVVLCSDCSNRLDACEIEADSFARKYNL